MSMNLVVGATGMLGSEICRLLLERGEATRALVRDTSNPETVERLRRGGAELVIGDLKDRGSLDTACRGVDTVISTASSTLSRQDSDSIETVDRQGQLALVDAAVAARVNRFVLISFPDSSLEFPLQSAKRSVEHRLAQSGLAYTILRPTFFMEIWLSPALGFDAGNGTARVYGDGSQPVSWISFKDVAAFAVAAADTGAASHTTIALGGPEPVSPNDVVRAVEQLSGRKMDVQHVPVQALHDQYAAATDPLQKSFAALMVSYADGQAVDMRDALARFPGIRLSSVREHLERSFARA